MASFNFLLKHRPDRNMDNFWPNLLLSCPYCNPYITLGFCSPNYQVFVAGTAYMDTLQADSPMCTTFWASKPKMFVFQTYNCPCIPSILETVDCQTQDLPISHEPFSPTNMRCESIWTSLAKPRLLYSKPNTLLFISAIMLSHSFSKTWRESIENLHHIWIINFYHYLSISIYYFIYDSYNIEKVFRTYYCITDVIFHLTQSMIREGISFFARTYHPVSIIIARWYNCITSNVICYSMTINAIDCTGTKALTSWYLQAFNPLPSKVSHLETCPCSISIMKSYLRLEAVKWDVLITFKPLHGGTWHRLVIRMKTLLWLCTCKVLAHNITTRFI